MKTLDQKEFEQQNVFGLGAANDAYARYFTGQSYLNTLTKPEDGLFLANVTFEPGCRNNWHIHHKGGQILLVLAGEGFVQFEGEAPRVIRKGDVVRIPPEVKHWHGAGAKTWMTHISIEPNVPNNRCTWLEAVSDEDYAKAVA